jgi:SprT protein
MNRVEECFVIAENHFGQKFPRAVVRFDLTGKTAGTSFYAKKLLRFNRKLLIDNEAYFMETCLPHEISHHISRHLFSYKNNPSHGPHWKRIMVEVFRLPPKRCHSLDVSKTRRKTTEYRYICLCPNKFHFCGLNKHEKIRRGNTECCSKCNSKLVFDGKGHSHAPTKLIETEL